jgi:type I restriction enzyme S subunit
VSGLPSKWAVIPLRAIAAKIVDGSHNPPAKADEGYPMLSARNVQEEAVHFDDYRLVSPSAFASEHKRTKIQPGDVLLTIVGAIGRTAVVRGEQQFVLQRSVAVIGELQGVEPRFLSKAFLNPSFQQWLNDNAKGTAQKGIYLKRLASAQIAIPPLPEQRRIVAKIDSLSAKSGRARDQLDHIPQLVKKYKQAILAAAFRGELTREWRNAKSETVAWTETTAGKIIQDIVAGKNLRCEERPPAANEIGVLKVSAVTWGSFNPQATKTLPKKFVPSELTRVRPGDFLISRANTIELVGAVVIVAETPPNLFLSDKVLRLGMAEENKPWMLWFLRSPQGRAAIEESSTGNQLSMRNLSQAALREIVVPLPNRDEQREIVRRIETAFAWIDRLAAEATSARKLIDTLDQAVLAKAFRGELVPQDPNDEPASVLLERIRAEREVTARPKRVFKKAVTIAKKGVKVRKKRSR